MSAGNKSDRTVLSQHRGKLIGLAIITFGIAAAGSVFFWSSSRKSGELKPDLDSRRMESDAGNELSSCDSLEGPSPMVLHTARAWAAKNFGNYHPDAWPLSPVCEFDGKSYCVMMVEGKNELGRMLSEKYIFEFWGEVPSMCKAYRPEEFTREINDRKSKLAPGLASELELSFEELKQNLGLDPPPG